MLQNLEVNLVATIRSERELLLKIDVSGTGRKCVPAMIKSTGRHVEGRHGRGPKNQC